MNDKDKALAPQFAGEGDGLEGAEDQSVKAGALPGDPQGDADRFFDAQERHAGQPVLWKWVLGAGVVGVLAGLAFGIVTRS